MKRSRLLPALGLLTGALFWGCFSDDAPSPTSPDTIQELQLKGSISGTVTDSVNHGISGVAVTLDSGGFATNTDSLGRYTIPDVPGRTWTVRFTKVGWRDTSIAKVILAIDEDKAGVNTQMRRAPLSDRQVLGTITSAEHVSRIECLAQSSTGEALTITDLAWNPDGTFAGLLPIGTGSGSLQVLVHDTSDHVIGKTNVPFGANASAILVPTFSAQNAIPHVSVVDTFGPIGDTLRIRAKVTDNDAEVSSIQWSIEGSSFSKGGSDTLIKLPSIQDTSYRVVIRVTDLDGNIAFDTGYIDVDTFLVDVRDGQLYRTATFGTKTWMVQNLNLKTDSSAWYLNNADSGKKYGRYYQWADAMRLPDSCNDSTGRCVGLISSPHRGICPTGWHIPSLSEAQSAAPFINLDWSRFREMAAGYHTKEAFNEIKICGYYWNTSRPNVSGNMIQNFPNGGGGGFGTAMLGTIGLSIRCIKD